MHTLIMRSIVSVVVVLMFMPVVAKSDAVDVVPKAEKEIARNLGVAGPTETIGIASSVILGSVELGGDFAALQDRSLRARRVTVAPGGVVGVHQHTARPGVLYVLEGELIEFRNDHEGRLIHKQGDVSFEEDGVIRWWRNDSDADALAFVVDIVPNDTQRSRR